MRHFESFSNNVHHARRASTSHFFCYLGNPQIIVLRKLVFRTLLGYNATMRQQVQRRLFLKLGGAYFSLQQLLPAVLDSRQSATSSGVHCSGPRLRSQSTLKLQNREVCDTNFFLQIQLAPKNWPFSIDTLIYSTLRNKRVCTTIYSKIAVLYSKEAIFIILMIELYLVCSYARLLGSSLLDYRARLCLLK